LDFGIPILGQTLVFQVQHQYGLRLGRRGARGARGHGGDGHRVRARRRQFQYALHGGRGRGRGRRRRGRRGGGSGIVVEHDVRTEYHVLVEAAGVFEAHAAPGTRVLRPLVAPVLADVPFQALFPLVHLAAQLALELLGQRVRI